MAVRAQCPRCKQPLSVPNKLAGSYASCPRCQGRFWVSKDAPLDPSVGDSGLMPSAGTLTLTQAPVAPPPTSPSAGLASNSSVPAAPPVATASATAIPPPRQFFPSVTPQSPSVAAPLPQPRADSDTSAPPVAPPQARKVARLVSADSAPSSLKLAADGQLPLLLLQEDDKKDSGKGNARSISPLALVGAWFLSVVLTLVIVLVSGEDSGSGVTTQANREALAKIEEQYFGNPAHGELLPYQRLLREARQARARREPKAEQQCYRQVLDLLHAETWDGDSAGASRSRLEKGVTGSRDRDRELEQLILTVLAD